MFSLRDLTRLSARCSRDRERVMITLLEGGQMSIPEIAARSGVRAGRVLAALEGELPGYALDLALVYVGLARRVATVRGREYDLTDSGAVEARVLAGLRAAGRVV